MSKCVIAINECDFGSTGNIARNILRYLESKGYETYLATNFPTVKTDNSYQIAISKPGYLYNKILCRFAATDGFHSKSATKKLINFIREKNPDYLYLHNLHGGYINLGILFDYIKSSGVKVIWSLHDCWTFTGKCAHFTYKNCMKWKDSCGKCPCLHEHPRAYFFDKSKELLEKKKRLYSGLEKQVTFVAPSQWLINLFKQSHLKDFDIRLIGNGITNDTQIEDCSNKLDLDNLTNKIVLFSSGMPLGDRKGMNLLNKLANDLDPNKFAIIVAGADHKRCNVNKKIIDVGLLSNRHQMNFFYNLADAYINLTLEENYPTVNMESVSMGTPVITFDTGGCKETIAGVNNCKVIDYNDYDQVLEYVLKMSRNKISKPDIEAYQNEHSVEKKCSRYYELFK